MKGGHNVPVDSDCDFTSDIVELKVHVIIYRHPDPKRMTHGDTIIGVVIMGDVSEKLLNVGCVLLRAILEASTRPIVRVFTAGGTAGIHESKV